MTLPLTVAPMWYTGVSNDLGFHRNKYKPEPWCYLQTSSTIASRSRHYLQNLTLSLRRYRDEKSLTENWFHSGSNQDTNTQESRDRRLQTPQTLPLVTCLCALEIQGSLCCATQPAAMLCTSSLPIHLSRQTANLATAGKQ